jgi:hypothetical protein
MSSSKDFMDEDERRRWRSVIPGRLFHGVQRGYLGPTEIDRVMTRAFNKGVAAMRKSLGTKRAAAAAKKLTRKVT